LQKCDSWHDPIVVGTLYNGQREGGVMPTLGGEHREADADPFDAAHDHATSGQGNLAGGNSPVWVGASPDHPITPPPAR